MKALLVTTAMVLATHSVAFGQTTQSSFDWGQLVSDIKYSSEFEMSNGSTKYDGMERTDIFMLTPSFTAASGDYAATVSVPLSWSDSSETRSREAGRPMIQLSTVLRDLARQRITAGSSIRLPMYSSSIGNAELYRVWQVKGFVRNESFIKRNTITTGASLEFDETAETSDFEFRRAPTFRAHAGIEKRTNDMALGATIRAIYGLGDSNFKLKDSNSEITARFFPVERVNMDLYIRVPFSETRSLKGGLMLPLRKDNDRLMTGAANIDQLRESNDNALFVSMAQQF